MILWVSVGAAAGAIELMRPGFYFDDDLPQLGSSDWLCITASADRVRAEACHPELVADAGDDALGGRELRVREGFEPIFLVSGWKRGGPADVPTYLAEEAPFRVGEMKIGTSNGARFFVEKTAEAFCIRLRDRGLEQTLACPESLDINGATALHWAGDLDGDGRIDLLVDVTPHYAGTDLRLYLSTRARAGELVGEAARLVKPNC